MLSIRRIMHQTGYKDGDPISAEDQSYIVENVFNYHPDKDAKMGSGIKHIMGPGASILSRLMVEKKTFRTENA